MKRFILIFALLFSVACNGNGSNDDDGNSSSSSSSNSSSSSSTSSSSRSSSSSSSSSSVAQGVTQKGDGAITGTTLVSETTHYKLIVSTVETFAVDYSDSSGGNYQLTTKLRFN